MRHPEREALDPFLHGLDTGAAGLVLHLLRCEDCAARAVGSLAPPEQVRGLPGLRRGAAPVDDSALWERIDETSRKAPAACGSWPIYWRGRAANEHAPLGPPRAAGRSAASPPERAG